MSREAYAAVGLGVIAAGVLASDPLLLWTQLSAELGFEWWTVVPSSGAPLLCLVATLVAARSYGLRSVAAGAVIAVGLVALWSSAWRLVWPAMGVGWLSLVGGLLAIAAGIALLYLRTSAAREAQVAPSA